MIEIDGHRRSKNGYGYTVQGNRSEEELFILHSPSQAFKGPLLIVAMQVDGGVRILFDRRAASKWVPEAQVVKVVQSHVLNWACGGVVPSSAEREVIIKKVAGVTRGFAKHFGYVS